MKIILSKYKWWGNEKIQVTGFIRSGDRYLWNEDLIEYFSGADNPDKFEQMLKSANGQFSVIIRWNGELLAAVDRLRNYPLFYTDSDGEFFISDDSYKLAALRPDIELNRSVVNSFLLSGYVINNLTLIENVFQIEAGSYVRHEGSVLTKYYHDPRYEITRNYDLITGAKELVDIFSMTLKDHLQALSDRFIAIPLSGGYDSRLVVSMVARYHPQNVLCYTYGIKKNPEIAIAKKVAERLGLKWINIIYDSELIDGFVAERSFKDYYPYASGLSSMFFLQEYFAVKYLKEHNIIPDDSVFIPGLSGDMLAGSYLFPRLKNQMNKMQMTNVIFTEFFRLINNDYNSKDNAIRLISERIPDTGCETWKVFETWDIKERHAKFIVNSAKVFMFFGYEYVLPLWDNNLIDFCMNMPFNLRLDRKLYEYSLRKYIFRDQGLNFSDEINPHRYKKRFQRIKESVIKPYLPGWFKNVFFNLRNQVLYDEMTKLLMAEYKREQIIPPRQPNYYNSYLTQWYLLKTKEHFRIKE